MTAVTLSRPLWWVARRSLRLLTGLILMALVLGLSAGAADAAPPSAPRVTAPVQPVVTGPETVGQTPDAGIPPEVTSPTATASRAATPVTGAATGAVRADSDDTADRVPAADPVTVAPGQPDRRTAPGRPTRSTIPAGTGDGLPAGPRAPPLG
ncbi:hypothetical protein [Micromonospora sp. NPDC004704]